MLREKIFYKDELPVSVITANVVDYPFHFHDDMEIVYVLSGSIVLKSGYYTYTLKQGDMFILNDRDMHSLERTNEDNMVMMLQMDLSYFERYYSDLRNQFFVVDMEEDREEDLAVLRNILAEIMMEILQKGQGFEHKVIESTHNLISCLIADFCYVVTEDGKFQNETGSKTSKILAGRLNRIMDYMYENYERKLTLSEIAENEKLSIYYLSHIIKEATGLSFQDLLSYIRVEESEGCCWSPARRSALSRRKWDSRRCATTSSTLRTGSACIRWNTGKNTWASPWSGKAVQNTSGAPRWRSRRRSVP